MPYLYITVYKQIQRQWSFSSQEASNGKLDQNATEGQETIPGEVDWAIYSTVVQTSGAA